MEPIAFQNIEGFFIFETKKPTQTLKPQETKKPRNQKPRNRKPRSHETDNLFRVRESPAPVYIPTPTPAPWPLVAITPIRNEYLMAPKKEHLMAITQIRNEHLIDNYEY